MARPSLLSGEKVKLTIQLPVDLRRELQRRAEATGTGVTWQIAKALEEYFQRHPVAARPGTNRP